MSNTTPTTLLDTASAARRLGLSTSTLNKWRVTGEGPRFKKFGAAVRYDPADLQLFEDASTRNSTSEVRAA